MASLNTMVRKCAGLVEKTAQGDNTTSLTEKQIDVLERIYGKHFAG